MSGLGFKPNRVKLWSITLLLLSLTIAPLSEAKKADKKPAVIFTPFFQQTTAIESYLLDTLKVEDPNSYLMASKIKSDLLRGFEGSESRAFNDLGELTPEGETVLMGLFSIQSRNALREIFASFGREKYSNSMLLAPAGAGKTFTVQQLVSILSFGTFPEYLNKSLGITENPSTLLAKIREGYLKNTQIVSIDYELLSRDNTPDGKAFAKAEVRMRTILIDLISAARRDFKERGIRTLFVLEEIAQLPDLVLPTFKKLLDETGFKTGTTNLLDKGSEAGWSVLGITTRAEYRDMIKGDSANERRYKKVEQIEPTEAEALTILQGKRDSWTRNHGFYLTDATLEYIISMRQFFTNPPLAMPDSVLTVANDLLAYCADPENRHHGDQITTEEAYAYLIDRAHLPRDMWLPKNGKPPLYYLADEVKKLVVGHEEEIDQIARALKRGRATGFREMPVFIIMSESGGGKDTVMDAFNTVMFGHNGRQFKFNMAGLNSAGMRTLFEGGVTPEGEAPVLVSAMDEGASPNGIIGLNEIKDLPNSEFARLKTIVEEGAIRPRGKDRRTRPFGINAIFMMGQYGEELFKGKTEKEIEKIKSELTQQDLVQILMRGSADGKTGAMPYALIQRAIATGGLIFLNPSPTDRFINIVNLKLEKIIANFATRTEIALTVDKSLRTYIAQLAADKNMGTRGLDGLIKSLTETAVSEAYDLGLPMRGIAVKLSYSATKGGVVVQQLEKNKKKPPYAIEINNLLSSSCVKILSKRKLIKAKQ